MLFLKVFLPNGNNPDDSQNGILKLITSTAQLINGFSHPSKHTRKTPVKIRFETLPNGNNPDDSQNGILKPIPPTAQLINGFSHASKHSRKKLVKMRFRSQTR